MCGPVLAQEQPTPEAASGLHYYSFDQSFGGRKPVKVHVLVADLKMPAVKVNIALARNTVGRLQATGNIARNNGAAAAVNGGFFNRKRPYLPVGLVVVDGNILTKSLLNRSAIGISAEKKIRFGIPKFTGNIINLSTKEKIPIWGMNRPRKEDEVIIYTPEFGWRTKTNSHGTDIVVEDNMVVGLSEGNCPIPRNGYVISFHGRTKKYAESLPPGAPIRSEITLTDGWDKYDHIISGGPRLLDNGNNVAVQSFKDEWFGSEVMGKNARTAVGIDRHDNLFLVVVEGKKRRRPYRRTGASYSELADLLRELGVKDAIGLDGGGSSTMYYDGKLKNKPLDGSETAVSNAIVIKLGR